MSQRHSTCVVFRCVLIMCLAIGQAERVTKQITAHKQSHVSISCPQIISEANTTYTLKRNDNILCTLDINTKPSSTAMTPQFKVAAANAEFQCSMKKRYPPPLGTDVYVTKVHVDDNALPTVPPVVAPPTVAPPTTDVTRCPDTQVLWWWVACGVLVIYSLSITCFLMVKKVKMKTIKRDIVYANTKPRNKTQPS